MVDGYLSHAEQIIAGFCELAHSGRIDLAFVRASRSGPRPRVQIRATVEGRRVAYDTWDDGLDGLFDPGAADGGLGDFDFCFKRSFDPKRHAASTGTCRIEPLGLNYLVSPNSARLRDRIRLLDARRVAQRLVGHERQMRRFEIPPAPDRDPVVLFMTRAWDPDDASDPRVRDDWAALNESRAAYVRALREEFGSRFYGGLHADEFSRHEYGDCLLPSRWSGSQRAFLERMHRSSICVASTGLMSSIGWKMAEYVAASRAIVSETLRYVVPGGFARDRNYLEYGSTQELLMAVERLLADDALRHGLMRANWAYYQAWVRPDALVLNTILTALELR
jgi:hypothetical protein